MNLDIHFTNIRGFKSNFNAINFHLASNKPAVLCLGEAQVSDLGDANDFQCAGYARLDLLVPHRDIILFVRNDIHYHKPNYILTSKNPAFNTLWIEIKIRSHSIFLCSLYRSPNLSHADTCTELDKISINIDQIYRLAPSAEIIVLGDFNVHNDRWLGFSQGRDQTGEVVELFAEINLLSQLVDKPTRYPDRLGQSPHLLDLFLTTHPDKYTIEVNPPLGLSDHAVVSAKSAIIPDILESSPSRHLWHFRHANWEGLIQFLQSFYWERLFASSDVEDVAKGITATILMGMKKFIPSSFKKSQPKKNKWFDRNCRNVISDKKAAHLIYIRDPSDVNLTNFRLARNKANTVINRTKYAFDQRVRDNFRKVLNNLNSNRTFWSFAGLVKRNFNGKTASIPTLFYNNVYYKTPCQKANLLASQFSLASNLPSTGQIPPILPSVDSSMTRISFRYRVVSRILSNLDPKKATGPDGIPAIVLKKCHNSLARPLSKLFHLSMQTGIFPSIWKTSNIQPVPKKGDKSSPSNYRPIALLSIMSKVMESIVNFNITKYLNANTLLSDRQYGFRKGRSSGDLMAYLVHGWERSIERFGESSVLSLDIAKAFDRVWHECLISKIRSLNIHSSVIAWISSYLSNRKIQVVIDGIKSESHDVNAGVPQGSSLSPTLFLIYINDLLMTLPCDIHSFADDTTLSASIEFNCQKESNSQITSSRIHMNDSMSLNTNMIIEWGKVNRVEFNPQKFQACLFSKKRNHAYTTPIVNGVPIEQCSSIRMLGLEISGDLSWKDHIYSVAKKAAQCVGFIRRCNFYFTPEEVVRLYKAYIRPIMEFNSFVWGGAPKTHLACLDRIQNRVIQMINKDSITSSLDSLEHRRNISALTVFYQYCLGNTSNEIKSLIPDLRVSRANTRFNSRQHKYALELNKCRTTHFKSSFFPRVMSMWNQLEASMFPDRFHPQEFKKRLVNLSKQQGAGARMQAS